MLHRPHAVTAFAIAALAGPLYAGDAPTFTDATATRLSAAPGVGSADLSEKDYAAADFDNDGDLDVFVARRRGLNGNNGSPLANTLLMNENGVLTDRTADLAPDALSAERSRDVVAADFDADGNIDVLVADGPSERPKLLLNLGPDGGGVWQGFAQSQSFLPLVNMDAWTVAAGDLANDDDAFPDLFFGTRNGNDRIWINLGESEGVWLGFADESTRLGTNANTSAVRSSEIVDMNADGDLDLVQGVTNPTGAVRIVSNDGSGNFTGATQSVISGAAYNFATGDLDDDGDLDVVGVRNGSDQYRLNTGPGAGDTVNFAGAVTLSGTNGFGAIARTVDLDGDGALDVLICDLDQEFPQDCARRLKVFLNTGGAPLLAEAYPTGAAWTPNGTSDVQPLDLDGDGDLDLLIGHCTGNSVFLQDGSPSVPGDVDGDGLVNFVDLLAILSSWGPCVGCAEDLDGSGDVGLADLLLVLSNWTP